MDTLSLFNQQVLQCQDDAYTLAWYLLGNEQLAEAVTQAAVKNTFQCFSSRRENCRLLILKQIIQLSKSKSASIGEKPASETHAALQLLPIVERQVMILVDILSLSYSDAAVVLMRPVKEIVWLMAQARRIMVHQTEMNLFAEA